MLQIVEWRQGGGKEGACINIPSKHLDCPLGDSGIHNFWAEAHLLLLQRSYKNTINNILEVRKHS